MPQVAALPLALNAVSSVFSFVGQRKQAKATEAAAEFNAKVAENEAINVENERRESARRERRLNRRKLGKQRALIAKAGVLETGSPLELMAETAGELEVGVLDFNRQQQAKQRQLRSQAAITRFEGKQKAKGLRLASIGTAIKGGAQLGFGTASLLRSRRERRAEPK